MSNSKQFAEILKAGNEPKLGAVVETAVESTVQPTADLKQILSNNQPEIGPIEAAKEGILALAPGLKDILSDIGAELGRLGVQGQMELASAIFNGGAFVPYGPGQYKSEAETAIEPPAKEQPEQERGGMGM